MIGQWRSRYVDPVWLASEGAPAYPDTQRMRLDVLSSRVGGITLSIVWSISRDLAAVVSASDPIPVPFAVTPPIRVHPTAGVDAGADSDCAWHREINVVTSLPRDA